jgi:carbon storage regulator
MLVLSRKVNERIVIDGCIEVTVVRIERNQIRLGIEAPEHVRVFREEIRDMSRTPPEDAIPRGIRDQPADQSHARPVAESNGHVLKL